MFLVGLEEPLDIPVGLWSPTRTQRVSDVVFMKIAFELVVETGSLVLVEVDEFRAVIGDDLQNWDGYLESLMDSIE